jgi:arylsulfatase A-like enzyme
MKVHIKAGVWSGVLTGFLFSFLESIFLLFTTGSILANFLFFLKAALLYGVVGAVGGLLIAALLKSSLLREVSWEEEKLKSFYFSLFFGMSLFVEITVYLLDIVFPVFGRAPSNLLYMGLVAIFSAILSWLLFKFLSISKLGRSRREFIPFSLGILLIVYYGLFLMEKNNEQQFYRAKKVSSSDQRPNFLIISMDTTRADRFSCYGHYRQTTPHIDQIAREGRLFKNAISPSTWTVPSHMSLFTGVYPSKHGVGYLNTQLPEDLPTLAEILSRNGYRTFSIYNNPFVGRMVGGTKGFNEAIGVNLDRRVNLTLERLFERFIYNDIGANSKKTVDLASNWISTTAGTGLPYFAFVHFNDAHSPYRAREPYFSEFVKDLDLTQVDLSKVQKVNAHRRAFHKYLTGEVRPSRADFEYLKALYDSEIRFVDEQIGKLLEFLKQKGFLKNTLVIITADHGEYIGEHNLMNHHFYLYNTVLHIPMIFWYPERIQPGVDLRYASLVDILPTVLSLASLESQIPSHVQGVNLITPESQDVRVFSLQQPRPVYSEWWGWLLGEASQDKAQNVSKDGSKAILKENLTPAEILNFAHQSSKDSSKAIYDGVWKLIWLSNGKHELYNLAHDPNEQRNLIEAYPEKVQELQAKLDQWLGSFQQARAMSGTNKKQFRQMLRSLGYVQ